MAHVPSPADAPSLSARALLARIRRRGGRIYRMQEVCVFVLTSDPDLAQWLQKLGAMRYTPASTDPTTPMGAYKRAPDGAIEWDLYIHTIPVLGEQTIWEAAAKDAQVTVEEIA